MLKSHIFNQKIITGITGFILGIVLILTLNVPVVHADGLNANESAIISAAQGTFESNGVKYQVDPAFVGQLISYLNQEDVDLNASQAEEAKGLMFSNVERGVAEGYLIAINGQVDNNENQDDSGESDKDISEEEDEVSGGDKNIEGEMTTSEDGNTTQENDNNVLDEIRKQPTTKTEVDQNKNIVTVTKEDNSDVIVVSTVIKNTGYNLKPAITVMIGLLGIFMLCILLVIKYNFFRQEEH